MNQKNKLQQNSINFFKLFIVSSLLPWISLRAAADRYKDCAPIDPKCGFKLKIAYPFWDSRQQDYCGHPAFRLECVDDSYLTITIEKETYKVININYETNSFTISKPQFFVGECPKSVTQLANSTLNEKVFKFSNDTQNAMLFYDCSNQGFDDDPPYGFSCKLNGYTGKSSSSSSSSDLGYLAINRTWELQLRENCGVEVFVPILMNSARELVSGASNIEKVLNKGFEVQWGKKEVGQCDDCQNSGGRCGYNRTSERGVCFCENGGVFDRVCGGSTHQPQGSSSLQVEPKTQDEQKSKQNLTMLGAGIGVSVLLSMILCFFFYRRHRKKESSMKFHTNDKSFGVLSSKSSMQFLTGSTYFGVQVFNYRELEEATEFFNPVRELGEGGFGTVYYGKLRDGREVAIKRLYENNSKRAEQFLNEVEILANLRHKNLVNLYGCTSRQSRELLLVYEYVPNGTVADHLHGKQSKLGLLTWSTRLSIATETASALVYLHDSDIIHRDVKTQNILLDTEFTVKVADFGLSRLFPLDVTHVSTAPQGTPGYVDPEYHQCYQLTEKSDVYSFGVLLAELISSLPAVDITRKRNEINLSNLAMNKIQDHALHELVDSSLGFESDYKIKKEITTVSELCFQCLQSTKEMRPTMSEVFKRLLSIQSLGQSEMDSAEVLDIPADDVLMLKGDFSPSSPPMEDTLANRYKLNASV